MSFDPKAALEEHDKLSRAIREHFGYVERWRFVPLSNETKEYWMLFKGEDSICSSSVPFTKEIIEKGDKIHTCEVRQDHVFRRDGYALIEFDTNTDGNKFVGLFDEKLECTDKELIELCEECW